LHQARRYRCELLCDPRRPVGLARLVERQGLWRRRRKLIGPDVPARKDARRGRAAAIAFGRPRRTRVMISLISPA
jgi:hypothetical protein